MTIRKENVLARSRLAVMNQEWGGAGGKGVGGREQLTTLFLVLASVILAAISMKSRSTLFHYFTCPLRKGRL